MPLQLSSLPAKPKTLNLSAWRRKLVGDVDGEFLLQGIEHGFHIVNSSNPPSPAFMHNYRSATMAPASSIVEKQILTELSEGRYLVIDNPPTLISALGAVPNLILMTFVLYMTVPNHRVALSMIIPFQVIGSLISLSMMPLNCLHPVVIAPKSIWNLHTDQCLFTQMIRDLWDWPGPSKGVRTRHIWLIHACHFGVALHQESSIALLNKCVAWWPGGVI